MVNAKRLLQQILICHIVFRIRPRTGQFFRFQWPWLVVEIWGLLLLCNVRLGCSDWKCLWENTAFPIRQVWCLLKDTHAFWVLPYYLGIPTFGTHAADLSSLRFRGISPFFSLTAVGRFSLHLGLGINPVFRLGEIEGEKLNYQEKNQCSPLNLTLKSHHWAKNSSVC